MYDVCVKREQTWLTKSLSWIVLLKVLWKHYCQKACRKYVMKKSLKACLVCDWKVCHGHTYERYKTDFNNWFRKKVNLGFWNFSTKYHLQCRKRKRYWGGHGKLDAAWQQIKMNVMVDNDRMIHSKSPLFHAVYTVIIQTFSFHPHFGQNWLPYSSMSWPYLPATTNLLFTYFLSFFG